MCFMFYSNHVENAHIIDQYRKINNQKFYNDRQTKTAAPTNRKTSQKKKKIEVQKVYQQYKMKQLTTLWQFYYVNRINYLINILIGDWVGRQVYKIFFKKAWESKFASSEPTYTRCMYTYLITELICWGNGWGRENPCKVTCQLIWHTHENQVTDSSSKR